MKPRFFVNRLYPFDNNYFSEVNDTYLGQPGPIGSTVVLKFHRNIHGLHFKVKYAPGVTALQPLKIGLYNEVPQTEVFENLTVISVEPNLDFCVTMPYQLKDKYFRFRLGDSTESPVSFTYDKLSKTFTIVDVGGGS